MNLIVSQNNKTKLEYIRQINPYMGRIKVVEWNVNRLLIRENILTLRT